MNYTFLFAIPELSLSGTLLTFALLTFLMFPPKPLKTNNLLNVFPGQAPVFCV